MLDFMMVATQTRKGLIEIYPKFKVVKSKDLMIRGGDFYAVWIEEKKLWSTDEQDVIKLVDDELDKYAKDHVSKFEDHVHIMYMWDAGTGIIDQWHKYCQKQMRDNYVQLDTKLIFSNQETTKEDYASRKLSYPLEKGSMEAYEEIVSTLYSPEERHKIEWAIGCVVADAVKNNQKFIVFYGPPGSGKSTILNIIQLLFEGYYASFDAETLGSSNSTFALEQFKSNPLVAICHDGDLSRIESNTKINSLVSHEKMVINEKHKALYTMQFNTLLLMGSNKPVRITDAKSGSIRRLIDIHPAGNKIPLARYRTLMSNVKFELGHIAEYCKEVYLNDPKAYEDYKPLDMMGESNDFYNFILDSYPIFKESDSTTLKDAWDLWKVYVEEARISYNLPMRVFKSELKNYFKNYDERIRKGDDWIRSYYSGFKTELLEITPIKSSNEPVKEENKGWLEFKEQHSLLDDLCANCPAQYGSSSEKPQEKWESVKTTLSDLDSKKLHYLRVPENHIVIDFDLKDENGEKSEEINLKEANKWPQTYAELSKSGKGIHLHYIYEGDVTELSRIYADDIEIKVFTGKSSLRRKLSKCNDIPVKTITSGLPLRKGGKKVVDEKQIKDVDHLRHLINKCLNKDYGATKPSMDFIYKLVEDYHDSGRPYDISDMVSSITCFAANSTNQSEYCMKLATKMHYKSEESMESIDRESDKEKPIVIFDIEVFPNLLLINWKYLGKDEPVHRMINPSPLEVTKLYSQNRIIGFNNRVYDNHILYARHLGYNNETIYNLSRKIIHEKKGMIGDAYNISYTDIFDYCSAGNKMSLKKWEIKLGLHHMELGFDWDKPVPEENWIQVSEYCDNDVISTEAVWNATQADFNAREILADLSGMSVNDTTNSITIRMIFGKERHPQLVYPDLSKEFPGYEFVKEWDDKTKKYVKKNMYRGTDLGFGGYVYAEPGMYGNVALVDVASMHPHSIIAMNLFGEYTKKFKELVDIRIHIKHKEYDLVRTMYDGKLAKYLPEDATEDELKVLAKKISTALKTPINSVYGLTSASFDNPCRDSRNENNVVALRGALFMRTLQDEVVAKGFKVAHIKTDSIKIPDATPEIIEFCMDFANKYGYTFEHEATYERLCIVNGSTYIAKYNNILDESGKPHKFELPTGQELITPWTATAAQFQVPYVFKKCFSKDEIIFRDLCETKSVDKSLMYLNYNELNPDEDNLSFIGKVGLFCPIQPGKGGGLLVKAVTKNGVTGFDSVTGAKGYRWMEAEEVQKNNKEADIDYSYFETEVNDAIDTISKYGDYTWFVSDDPYVPPEYINGVPQYLPF